MNRSFFVSMFFVGAASAAAVACGGADSNLPPPPPPEAPAPTTSPAPAADMAAPAPSAAPAPAAAPVTLQPGQASPDPAAPLPTVKIAAPTKGQVIKKDKVADFAVKLDVKNWSTAMGAAHVHLILDNRPYKPIYETKAPIKLSELTGGEALTEGQHVLVAFPSRANHESVKTKDAFTMVEFWVDKKGEATVDLKKPMLVYSRPKGEYKGEMANHVLVDFQLANATLGDKNTVAVTVTGPGIDNNLSAKVDKFGTPLYLDNLQNGTYSVKVELDGADGKALPGPWNSTSREIKINHDAPADPMPHAHDDAGKGADKPGKGDGKKHDKK